MLYEHLQMPRGLDKCRKRLVSWVNSMPLFYYIIAAILLSLVLWVSTNDWYYAISWPPTYSYYSFRRRWVVLYSRDQAAAEAAHKRSLPRYSMNAESFPDFPFYVVSLPDAAERRASAASEMKKHKIQNWEFFDAINGSNHMPLEEIMWYTRGKLLKKVLAGVTKTRRHTAALLTHLRLMHKMVAEGRDVQAVFEDDFSFLDEDGNNLQMLYDTMADLPVDWDVLWLYHGPSITDQGGLLGWAGPNKRVQIFTSNYVTLGLIYTRRLALKMLNEAQIGDNDFDNVIENLGKYKEVNAYVAVPAIVGHGNKNLKSQTEVPGFDTVENK